MKVRFKVRDLEPNIEGWASTFNVHSLNEVIVHFYEGDSDTVPMKELDVFVGGNWVDMHKAFETHAIVPNNYNTSFGEPINEECKQKGYNP